MEGGEGRRVEKKVVGVCGREVGGGGGERNCPIKLFTYWNTMKRCIHACTLTRNSFVCMHG